jgi:hypothetical protein
MKKIIFPVLVLSAAFGGEFDFGKGNFHIKGGFLGLNSEKSTEISSYTISQQHKNIFSSKWFYKYNITWYESNEIKNAQNNVNVYSNNLPYTLTTPVTDYSYEGLDVNVILGRDLVKTDNIVLGLGGLIGISLPWIESKKDDSNNDDTSSTILNNLKKSKTKIMTYKLGISAVSSFQFNDYFKSFISGSYAYQTGYVKNDYADVDTSVNGIYSDFELNFRFTPFFYKKKIWVFTLSPQLYFTVGYKYSKWIVKDLAIDISGNNLKFSKSDLEMSTNLGYIGVGYSF